ncbi:MAG TPA: thioesterase family protein, partial [Polyangiales bacterium]|nr:thioesterase family protein [Polyangiales bacterium]
MSDVIFRRDGTQLLPEPDACGPWSADRMHGGPVFGLIARAVEAVVPDPGLVATRFTFDLFRAVPLVPLEVQANVVRQSSRLCLVHAAVRANGEEFVSASVLLLREGEADQAGEAQHAANTPAGPEGLETETLMRTGRGAPPNLRAGYHVRVETRWPPRSKSEPLAIWFRMPLALVEGEEPTALQRAVQLSDFANAVASIAQRDRGAAPVPFINVDATLYFSRRPSGEWFCLQEQSVAAARGISVATCALYDERGLCGRVAQGRLANSSKRSAAAMGSS